ncbi:serine protease inhibitor Kazal-type 1 [Drosophila simulans]|uniref:Kazal-like domain-containing protein n=1 Tax=Drosophila simulans TaxID=7240 RepID=A0A0J9TLN1_DROSI|nr:serine protease inhibitor Kazal-type 1 [Drosophila simulans]KMY89830.1 uncharacterized protein Dsimw501_GD28363 [Drosophila simulans]
MRWNNFFLAVCLLAVLLLTEAQKSRCPCPKIYQPVCGSDNITYSHLCLLICKASHENVNYVKKGRC